MTSHDCVAWCPHRSLNVAMASVTARFASEEAGVQKTELYSD
jgi:hypothetical protein